jgi:hypothetical protein
MSSTGVLMKNFIFLFLVVALALGVVACGNKNTSSGASTSFSSDPYQVSTVDGLVNVDNYSIIVGNTTYQSSQQSIQVLVNAVRLASQQGIPLNNARQLKAKITGSQQAQQQVGYTQQYPQQGVGNTLNITQAVVYR